MFCLLSSPHARERGRNKQREGERAHPDSRGRGARSSHGGLDARAGGSRPDSGPLPRAAADPAGRAERGGGVATSGGGPRQGRRAAGTGARRGRAVEADRGSARRGSRRRCPMGRPVSRRRRRRRGEEVKSGGVAVESAGDGGKVPCRGASAATMAAGRLRVPSGGRDCHHGSAGRGAGDGLYDEVTR